MVAILLILKFTYFILYLKKRLDTNSHFMIPVLTKGDNSFITGANIRSIKNSSYRTIQKKFLVVITVLTMHPSCLS